MDREGVHIVKKAHAAVAAVVGLALTATGVLAATPSPVSVIARDKTAVGGPHDNHGGAVSTVAKATSDSSTPTSDTPTTTSPTGNAQSNHGTAVSTIAQDKTAVGGPNNNHGGAVSAVARGTHGKTAAHGNTGTHGKSGTHPSPH